EAVDDEQPTLLRVLGEGALERARPHLLRRTVAPVARARRVGATAADVDRRADRAVARAPRALLLVELLRRAAHRGALLRGGGALPPRGELRLHDLVEELLLDLRREHVVGEIERADLLALHVVNVERCHL